MRAVAARLSSSLLVAGLWVSPAAAQITVVAGPATTEITASPGERVTVPIAVDLTRAPGVKLGAYSVSLRWKPALLRFVATAAGNFGAPVFNTDSAAQGVIKFAAAVPAGASGMVNLGGVTLEVLSTQAADTFRLAFQELVAAETFADLLGNLVVTSGLFCGGPVFGDVDDDGAIRARDAQIVLMHAVGLALPAGSVIARGDVDSNSKVDPRDALIILSKVVGLDVSQFSVGRLTVAACRGLRPERVSIRPRPIALAPGDRFLASAEVRDSAGNSVAGVNLAWSASDTTKVKVEASGLITAVAGGSAVITAAVAPGVTDTVTVTVGERHRWVVNPVVAAARPSQIGSDLYPFSTIKQALDRAQDGDTVVIGVATYNEPISTTKQLVFLGDSGAAGVPTISVPGGIAGDIVRPGKQVIRRLRIANSLAGLRIRADSVELVGVRFESMKGPALVIYGSKRALLGDLKVSGALGAGVWVDSTGGGVVSVQRVRVSGVEPAPIPLLAGADYALHGVGIFVRADAVFADSVRVSAMEGSWASDSAAVAGLVTVNAKRTVVSRAVFTDIGSAGGEDGAGGSGVGVAADTAVSVQADSVILRRIGGTGFTIRGDTLRVSNALVEDILGSVIDPAPGLGLLEVQDMTGARVGQVVFGRLGGEARIRRVQVREAYWSGFTLGAARVFLDSVWVQVAARSGYACGLELDSTPRVVQVNYSRFEHSGLGIGICSKDPVTTGDSAYHWSGFVSVRNSVIQGSYTGVHVHADSVLLEGDSIAALGWGVWQHIGGGRRARWFKVRDLTIRGVAYQGLYAEGAGEVEITGTRVSGSGLAALDLRKISVRLTAVRNTLIGNSGPGMRLADTVASAIVDTNLIADNGSSGILIRANFAGSFEGKLNSVLRNAPYGILDSSAAGGVRFERNNVAGNAFGALSRGADSLYAAQSWWGDSLGPRCSARCNPASRGDSVSAKVAFSPFASSPVSGAPSGGPAPAASALAGLTEAAVADRVEDIPLYGSGGKPAAAFSPTAGRRRWFR